MWLIHYVLRGCPQGVGRLLGLRRTCLEYMFENKVGQVQERSFPKPSLGPPQFYSLGAVSVDIVCKPSLGKAGVPQENLQGQKMEEEK